MESRTDSRGAICRDSLREGEREKLKRAPGFLLWQLVSGRGVTVRKGGVVWEGG